MVAVDQLAAVLTAALDLDRVIEALHRLDPIDHFIAIVRDIERSA